MTVDHAGLKRVRDWIWTLPPPAYPYPVDQALAARGAAVYQQHCVECHADHRFRDGVKAGARVGQVEPIDTIGTDRHRLDSYTVAFAANQYGLYPDSQYRFTHFRKTNGYANHPLDGIWLRGPYLHNGSVPTLRDLLEPPERAAGRVLPRLRRVRSGEGRIRRRTSRPTAIRSSRRYDTSVPGNGHGGHVYGTTLPDDDKRAIVEYMKTF